MLKFYKYEGAGNDFILIDNRKGSITLSSSEIEQMCNRNKGIGADGVILLETLEGYDFYMRYYNSDGSEVGMCGNGGRCISLFAHHLGIGGSTKLFKAKDGDHKADIDSYNKKDGTVSIKLIDIDHINTIDDKRYFLNSGVPHHVEFVDDIKKVDVERLGRKIRNSVEGGTNVNFCQIADEILIVRTYERGVEAETLACGTGATACAIAAHYSKRINSKDMIVMVLGGTLGVSFDDNYHDVTLTGPARQVFKGSL